MKKTTSAWLIATLLLMAQICEAQDKITIQCEPKPNGICDCKVQKYNDIKNALKSKEPKADFKVFWDFGDGTFAANKPGGATVGHRYKTATSYTVTAYFVVEYANQKFAPVSTSANISKVSNGESEVVSDFSIKSNLDYVVRIRPDDYFVLVVSTPSAGKINLDYDPSVCEPYGQPHGTAGVSLSANVLDSKGKQNIFVPMRTLKFGVNSAKKEYARIKARLNGRNTNMLSLLKQTAFDPNDMRADKRRLKWSEFNGKTDFPIKYTVRFENIGITEANHVAIKVKIPEGMSYKEKGNEGTFGLAAYGFGNTNIEGPNIITNYDCPICKDSNTNIRCLRVVEPENEGSDLVFEFQKIPLAPKTKGKENKGFIKYNLFLNKKIEKKTLASFAEIEFDGNGKPIKTNVERVRFKAQPRPSLRVGRTTDLPLSKANKANYEVGLSVSRLRPYGFYFPSEISVSLLPVSFKDVSTVIKGIPVRLTQQVRHNFLGGFLGAGLGLSANVSINNKKENQNTTADVSYTNILSFLDFNINALKQRPNLGIRLGYPLTEKFTPVNGTKGQFQIYLGYQF